MEVVIGTQDPLCHLEEAGYQQDYAVASSSGLPPGSHSTPLISELTARHRPRSLLVPRGRSGTLKYQDIVSQIGKCTYGKLSRASQLKIAIQPSNEIQNGSNRILLVSVNGEMALGNHRPVETASKCNEDFNFFVSSHRRNVGNRISTGHMT